VSILNPLFDAVAWVLMRIHAGLSVLFGPASGLTWVLTIVLIVVLMRVIMLPLFIKQVKSQRKMQAHMPQMRELQKRYKGDKQRQQEEMMKFYKENGINPLGGCLPLLAQLPMFYSLFYVLRAISEWTPGKIPSYGLTVPVVESALHAKVFGALLSDKVLFTGTLHVPLEAKFVIVVFVLISSTTTFLTMRQSKKRGMLQQPTADPDNPAANMTKYMMYITPLFALTGLYWQFGLVIYWVTTNVWTLGQQYFLFRNLPIVGSTTASSSAAPATPAAGGKSSTAKSGTVARTGTARTGAARPGTARPGTAKAGTAVKAGTAARTGTAAKAGTTARTSGAARPATAGKTATAGKPGTTGSAAGAATASGANGAKTSTTAKNGSAVKNGSAAKSGTAARNGSAVKTGAAAKTPAAKADAAIEVETATDTPTAAPADGRASSSTKANATGKTSQSGGTANGKVRANGTTVRPAAKETVQDTPSTGGGARSLLRFGRGKAEPEPEPVEETVIVRQQPVRQTRSKRSGKR
jgi:YidC/Oxa1 family membrane protein insertase